MATTRVPIGVAGHTPPATCGRPGSNYLAIQVQRLVPALSLSSTARSNVSPLAYVHRIWDYDAVPSVTDVERYARWASVNE